MTVMAVAAMAVGSMAGLARAVPLSKLQRAYTRPIHSDNLPVSLTSDQRYVPSCALIPLGLRVLPMKMHPSSMRQSYNFFWEPME